MISFNTIKATLQGALGGLTFGMYHHYITMKQIEEFNKQIEEFDKQIKEKYKIK